jgi:glycosyltransferase involved in cell wall biosynthesis
MPTIGIDYTPAYEQGGGIGRYVRELTAALAALETAEPGDRRYRLFVAGAGRKPLPPLPQGFLYTATTVTPAWWARIWHRAQLPLPIETVTGRLDLLHATDFVLPPTRPGTRTLLTVHDLSFVRVPESASPSLRRYLDRVVPRSVARADHILADSTATLEDLVALYGTHRHKISVLLSGVEPRFQPMRDADILARVRARYGLNQRPYIFAVGTVQPRKNYARLAQALARLRARDHDVDLAIAGGRGWLDDPIHAAIRAAGMTAHVHLLGYADDADLPALYNAAACVATPSLYEGFGLPVLEAMACGVPVLTASVSSLPEVAGDAALLVDPLDVEAIAQGLGRLLHDAALRHMLIERGLARASQLTWERAARQLRDHYQQMLTQAQARP